MAQQASYPGVSRLRHHLTRGPHLDETAAKARSARPFSGRRRRQAATSRSWCRFAMPPTLSSPFWIRWGALDYPKDRIKLVFCEGDSVDGSWDRLKAATAGLAGEYRDIVLLQRHVGTSLDRGKRAKPRMQRVRRGAIAKVRNYLIDHGLDDDDDWALWIDIDVWRFPGDIVKRLIATGHRIAVPNCVKVAGGGSFDLNNFVIRRHERDYRYYRDIRGGLHQPPRTRTPAIT